MDRKSLLILVVAVVVLFMLSGLINQLFPPRQVPGITWANPAAVVSGTALSGAQLDATADVPGSFSYNPPSGAVLPVGTNLLAATFTPADPNKYSEARAGVTLLVLTPSAVANQPGTPAVAPGAGTNVPAPTPGAATNPPPAAVPNPLPPEVTLAVSNQDLIFHFTSRGGGLKEIAVRNPNYPAVVHSARREVDEQSFATLNSKVPVPILAVLGEALGDDNFTLTQPSNTIVRAEKTLGNGLRVVKEFDIGDRGTNYLFTAKIRLENSSSASLPIPRREVVVGTATAIGPLDDVTTLGAIWYNGAKSADIGAGWFANRTLGCIPGTPRAEFQEGASNVVWAAMHSQYFALAAMPAQPAPGIVIRNLSLPPPDTDGVAAGQRLTLTNNYEGYQTALVYPATHLDPHQSAEQSFTFYAGPKEYNGLARIGGAMGNNLDLVMGFTGFLGFGFCSKMLLLSMNGLHAIGFNYGLAIIAITVIIKLVFWPLTAASTRSQKRQQAIAPQLKAIAEKYKEDPLKKHQKTTELMKEHKINPLGSCLPVLITIPVFFGFYSMLRNAIELRGVPFLWAPDLTRPDTIYIIHAFHNFPINPLPLLMGASQLWQSHLTPPSPGMDPGQQKIMRWMPLLFVGIFYGMSSGLNLYYTVSNLLTIAQTKITKMGPDPAASPAKRVAPAPQKKK
jgi:YidC/Oxa1 family membrane protein insertase